MTTDYLRPAPSIGATVRPRYLLDGTPAAPGCVKRVSIDTVTMDDGRQFSRWETEFVPLAAADDAARQGAAEEVLLDLDKLDAILGAGQCGFCGEDHRKPTGMIVLEAAPRPWRWTPRGWVLVRWAYAFGWFTAGALISQWIIR